jgi:phosphoribosylformylglycinamidine cyclo-ligase
MEGMDLSITVSGFVEKPFHNACRAGDVLIGIRSSGIHSNGFTMVRKVLGNRLRKEFTVPTTIYWDVIYPLIERDAIHGAMHITGGAFVKLKDILGKNDAVIEIPQRRAPQPIFREMYDRGLSSKTMYTTFNCGIGFVISASREQAKKIVRSIPNASVIGSVVHGSGMVHLRSAFDEKWITL